MNEEITTDAQTKPKRERRYCSHWDTKWNGTVTKPDGLDYCCTCGKPLRPEWQTRLVAIQRKLVEDWNAAHQPGAAVAVTKDDGTVVETVTRSHAALLGGHTAVVWLKGVRGCYALDRVRPAPSLLSIRAAKGPDGKRVEKVGPFVL